MDYYYQFLKINSEKILNNYRTKDDLYWRGVGEQKALHLFKEAAKRIPAYKKFLQKHKVDPTKVKTFKDFQQVPLTDKPNYIDKFKVSDLCWDGKIEANYLMSASSGSTGIPHYWPRSTEQTSQGALISELIYKEYFNLKDTPTLYIVAFAMGTWIAGTYMMMSTEWVAQKGYPVTVVTPGGNKEEILRLVKMGSNNYKQIILIGYPPFIKDVLDSGKAEGIDWQKANVKLMFSGEAITELWREHVMSTAQFSDILTGSINIYGSADVGLIAHETAVTTYLRRAAFKNKKILQDLFNSERIPSVNQYDPNIRNFERVGEELIITAPSGIPLIRYNTKDIGDVLYFQEAETKLKENGVDIASAFKKSKTSKLLWKLPMVYLFGRGKFTAIIYGANIYPEHVKLVLEHKRLVKKVTGKFVIVTEERKDHTQELVFHVELTPQTKVKNPKLHEDVKNTFISEVSKHNAEYKNNLSLFKAKVYPKIVLHEYGDSQYFPRGIVKKLA